MYPNHNESVSWSKFKRRVIHAVACIREENNGILIRRIRHYMYQNAQDSVRANSIRTSGKELSEAQQLTITKSRLSSDGYMSDE